MSTADRPTTEPRTEAGRRLLGVAYLRGDAKSEGVDLAAAILAIETEAAQRAAPRAEGPEHPYNGGTCCDQPMADHAYVTVEWVNGQEWYGPVAARGHTPGCVLATEGVSGHNRCSCSCHGAAPRAEGLDVERLRIAVMEGTDPDTGDVWLHREDADILRARLSRPSDERDPESEER